MFNLPLLGHLTSDTLDFYSRTSCTVDFHFYQGSILTRYLYLLIKRLLQNCLNNRNELNDNTITALCSDKLQYYDIYIYIFKIDMC